MVMRFSVEQKTRALVNDDLFPALAIPRKSPRNHESFARQEGHAQAQSPTPSAEPERTLSSGTGCWVTGGARAMLSHLVSKGVM